MRHNFLVEGMAAGGTRFQTRASGARRHRSLWTLGGFGRELRVGRARPLPHNPGDMQVLI